jgi:hypothetical protein
LQARLSGIAASDFANLSSDNANHDRLCRTGGRSFAELHIQDLVRDRYSLISRWTISLLKDHLISHRFAQRSLLLADPQSPQSCGGIEQERDFGVFPSDEKSLGFVVPIELEWPLLGCVHYFSSAYNIGQVRFRLNGGSL